MPSSAVSAAAGVDNSPASEHSFPLEEEEGCADTQYTSPAASDLPSGAHLEEGMVMEVVASVGSEQSVASPSSAAERSQAYPAVASRRSPSSAAHSLPLLVP